MASTFTPSTPATGPWAIDREDCIGDSLGYINANTNYFGVRVNSLSADLNTQITTLSTVPYARLNDGNQNDSAPIFGVRAWATWAGIGSNGPVASFTGGNVSAIERIASGTYKITFVTPMIDANYAISISSNSNLDRLDSNNKFTNYFQVDFFTGGGTTAFTASNPSFCSVMVIR